MTTAGCQPMARAGLTWRRLAASAKVTEPEMTLRRGQRPPSGPVQRAIAALARDLPGGGSRDDGEGS